MSIDYRQMIWNIGISALVSAISQLPCLNSLHLCSNEIKEGIRSIHSSLYVVPWTGLCCTMFVKNLLVRLVALKYTEAPEARHILYISTMVYCSVFLLALEMILHWAVIFFLERDNIPTYIKCPSRELILN
ncbi:uncharacterized protein Dwil_GK19019 [Drosophila willistoni]|uniref:Uncharacterized protein n=1 Tax=Drosophila willistoni TaxID=7260 RepID=B4MWX9_DROWI|nr:uncharacterized protein Dwil_GK19019 [Drosophila willistoni]